MNNRLKKTVLAALLAALTYTATTFLRIPAPLGYINLGDCFVILSGFILGPVYGPLAGGIGSMLSDLFGYPVFAPATLLIKSAMALSVAILSAKAEKHPGKIKAVINASAAVISELIMIFGYFVFECFLYNPPAAAAEILPNLIQGAAGAVCGWLVYTAIGNTVKKMLFK